MPSRALATQAATGDRVVYVSNTGSDSNDGRSAGSAFATIAAAHAALGANAGEIRIGGGTHAFPSLTVTNNSVSLIGRGKRSTVLNVTSGPGITFDGSASSIRYAYLANLQINGQGQAADGLTFTNGVECLMDNITVNNFAGYGLKVAGGGFTFYVTARSSTFAGCGTGAYVNGQLPNFIACRFQGNTTLGVEDLSTGGSYSGSGFEGNGTGGINIVQNGGKSLFGCYFENNGSYHLKSEETKGLTIMGGRAYSGATPTDIGFDLGRSSGSTPTAVTIRGVHFVGPHTTAAIKLNRTTADIDCHFESETTDILTV